MGYFFCTLNEFIDVIRDNKAEEYFAEGFAYFYMGKYLIKNLS